MTFIMPPRATLAFLIVPLLFTASALSRAQAPEPNGGGVEPGILPAHWQASGPKCMEIPDWQVHEYNANFYIVRQSGCLDYEKPFVYLIFGKDRGLLFDTGSRNFPAAAMVENVVGKWLERNNRKHVELLVVHSHAHGDHVAGDEQLKNLKSETITVKFVPATLEATKELYGISNWPEQVGSVDLGGRVIDAIPIPGHNVVSVALYDRQTAILLTGDSLYPGRLYVRDWDDFVKSTARLVSFTKGKLIAHILGCHVEQSQTPFLDYPVGTIYQPNEHALELSRGDLLELMDTLAGLHAPTRVALRNFSVWPNNGGAAAPTQAARDEMKARAKQQQIQKWNQPQ